MSERKSQWELFLEEEENPTPKEKRCPKCKKYKLLSEYYTSKRGVHGVRSQCKACEQRRKYRDRADRFWKFFYTRVERKGGCLEWTGSYTDRGQPRCQYMGKTVRVRRLVHELSLGPIPEGMFVLSTCGNERCVSRYHMKLGTSEDLEIKRVTHTPTGDNHYMRQRFPKCPRPRRGPARGERHGSRLHPENLKRGEQHGRAKLTEDKVREIRRLAADGRSKIAIANAIGISRGAVRHVLDGETWKHVQ